MDGFLRSQKKKMVIRYYIYILELLLSSLLLLEDEGQLKEEKSEHCGHKNQKRVRKAVPGNGTIPPITAATSGNHPSAGVSGRHIFTGGVTVDLRWRRGEILTARRRPATGRWKRRTGGPTTRRRGILFEDFRRRNGSSSVGRWATIR
jgi:hypothetical protein